MVPRHVNVNMSMKGCACEIHIPMFVSLPNVYVIGILLQKPQPLSYSHIASLQTNTQGMDQKLRIPILILYHDWTPVSLNFGLCGSVVLLYHRLFTCHRNMADKMPTVTYPKRNPAQYFSNIMTCHCYILVKPKVAIETDECVWVNQGFEPTTKKSFQLKTRTEATSQR